MANSKKSNSTNQINMAIMFLSVALTALLAVLIFVPSSNGGYQATPTPIYLDHNGNPTATPTVEPNATPNAGTNTATPAPTATPTATPTLAPGAVHGKEQGKLYVVQGAVDTQIYIRKIVNGSVSWEDKNLDRLVPGSYFNVVSEESSAYYIMYNGEKWYMDKSWFSSGVSIAAVTEEDAYYHLELTSIFTYSNLNDRKIFTLFGTCDATNSQWNLVTIENQSKGFKVTSKNYTENYSADGLTYTITFKDANNLLAPGQYVVDDEWYWTITVTADGGIYQNDVQEKMSWLHGKLSEMLNHFKVVSFDNLGIAQLQVKRLLTAEEWESFYMGDDGNYTFYIDMVDGTFGKNSLATERYPIMDNIDDMFNKIKGEQ